MTSKLNRSPWLGPLVLALALVLSACAVSAATSWSQFGVPLVAESHAAAFELVMIVPASPTATQVVASLAIPASPRVVPDERTTQRRASPLCSTVPASPTATQDGLPHATPRRRLSVTSVRSVHASPS